MTDKEVMQQALEALENERYVTKYTHIVEAITALRTALEQPQQQAEPEAWLYKTVDAGLFVSDQQPSDVEVWNDIEWSKPLYPTPPQRQWVGLTDEDVNRESAPIASQMKLAFHAGMYVAQKLLKERNT